MIKLEISVFYLSLVNANFAIIVVMCKHNDVFMLVLVVIIKSHYTFNFVHCKIKWKVHIWRDIQNNYYKDSALKSNMSSFASIGYEKIKRQALLNVIMNAYCMQVLS